VFKVLHLPFLDLKALKVLLDLKVLKVLLDHKVHQCKAHKVLKEL
jgi:hypothetical protein